ncbi:MAG: hypothetical protein QNJ07_08295 [Woeseiaceae bacterium]|nr:hypothetical protein [Woeseiaceae bacterium]
MNYFSASGARPLRSGFALLASVFCYGACGEASPAPESAAIEYALRYTVEVVPDAGEALVTLDLGQSRRLLREMRMTIDPERHHEIRGDGRIDVAGNDVRWYPPADGGTIEWRVQLAHRRNGDGYDAWLGPEWGLFRAEDIIPRAHTRTLKGASSRTELQFEMPSSWTAVTEYFGRRNTFEISKPDRRFDQPSGWIVLGDLGVRRDRVEDTRLAVAAPRNQSVRRVEMLALLRWTLPELARVLPSLPRRLTIVSAGEPMWRGALSGPGSLFIHAERPLISENATSTLLHEVVHVSTRLRARPGHDWIVEGIAEYYSLEMLYRSGSISEDRYDAARRTQAEWAREANALCVRSASGPVTALAVTILAALDAELRSIETAAVSLDDVVSEITSAGVPVDLAILRNTAESLAGTNIETLHTDNLPGCRNITSVEK